jgi:CRP/FNR family cyclic AMP-dependent transcriptional regulator
LEYIFDKYMRKSDYRQTLLSRFGRAGCRIHYKKKELIECKHRPLNEVYLITKGKVKQYYVSKDGIERTILILTEGDMFGEITVYQGDFDMVITEALEETEVNRISKESFFRILDRDIELYNALLQMVTTKFRILMAQIYDNTFFSTKDRLINLLTRLSRQYGIKKEHGIKIDIKLTHQEIAYMIGTTRSTVTKALKKFASEGMICQKNKHIFLTDEFIEAKLKSLPGDMAQQ